MKLNLKIQVNKKELSSGDRDNPEKKPAALALNRHLRYPYRAFSTHDKIKIYNPNKECGIESSFPLPKIAKKAETCFLLNGFARPYYFYLELPLEILK